MYKEPSSTTSRMKARWRQAVRKLHLTEWDTPMLRPERLEIQFSAPGAVYFPQQTVTGKVVLQVAEPLRLKGVKMRFRGECCIYFTDYPKKLENLNMIKKTKRKGDHCNTPDQFPTTMWSARHTKFPGGVTNPGYIPDHDGCESGSGLEVPQKCQLATRRASHRPRSTESAWLQGSISGPRQHYRAQETYFDCEFYIYGHKYQKGEKEMLPAGLHEFPFAFILPPNLPPSFNSEKGFIGYMALAILDRPAAANLVQKAGFSLHTILNLNMISHSTSSSSSSTSKNVCCFCCQTGPITLAARIPRQGYVPGEEILVSAEVDNISSRSTRRTRLLLLQVITYIMPNGVKEVVEERVVKEVVRGMIPPGESDLWENVALVVPPLVPANIHLTCRLLHVKYRLDMILELPVPSSEMRVSLPLIIGSVPLRNRFSSFLPPSETRKVSDLPGIKYPNYPSHWFGECTFGSECLETQYEHFTGMQVDYDGFQYTPFTHFAPRYICYTPGNKVDSDPR
ncbi:arrestin domain-containing protein 17-like [Cherax quadricarinatus]|uniref:arrestin domain-containing protein 17-like n=1 Tax=Cherax quadricarinatus TaxID=27406 RepID=UPI0023786D7F|nr:arrestin domain-containing protein 3-like [Cherax quadricarinatus]